MNEQAYKYVAELIHELYEEKLKVHRYRHTLEEIREMLKEHPFCDCSCGDDILAKINEVSND